MTKEIRNLDKLRKALFETDEEELYFYKNLYKNAKKGKPLSEGSLEKKYDELSSEILKYVFLNSTKLIIMRYAPFALSAVLLYLLITLPPVVHPLYQIILFAAGVYNIYCLFPAFKDIFRADIRVHIAQTLPFNSEQSRRAKEIVEFYHSWKKAEPIPDQEGMSDTAIENTY